MGDILPANILCGFGFSLGCSGSGGDVTFGGVAALPLVPLDVGELAVTCVKHLLITMVLTCKSFE